MAQFDDIEAAFAVLVLADERLRDIQPLGDIHLGKSSLFAQLPQYGTQLLVLRRVERLLHPESAPCRRIYPNLGYLELLIDGGSPGPMTQKRALVASRAAIGAGLLAAAVAISPQASAAPAPDIPGYIQEVQAAGVPGTSQRLMDFGAWTCRTFASTSLGGTQIQSQLMSKQPELTSQNAAAVVGSAVENLCPQWSSRL